MQQFYLINGNNLLLDNGNIKGTTKLEGTTKLVATTTDKEQTET